MIVLDVSAAVSLVIETQATEASEAFFARAAPPYVAHAIFALELRNALTKLERRKLIDPAESDVAIGLIESALEIRPWRDQRAEMSQVLGLARLEKRSFYDACYLYLAEREGAELATRDGPLVQAAQRRGLSVHDLR